MSVNVVNAPKLGGSYVEWSAIIAGTVIACAVSVILLQFGEAFGFAIHRPYAEEITAGKLFVVGLWTLWVQLMASMSGGYMAGRMRGPWGDPQESEIRDGAHGLLVWATATLVAIVAAAITTFWTALAANHGVDAAQVAAAKVDAIPAELARKYGVIFGFSMVATSLVSAVAAWWMGTVGGDHRDEVKISSKISFRRK